MLSRITEPTALIRLQSWGTPTAAPEPLERLLEVDWPFNAGSAVTGRAHVICIAPDDWLIHSESAVSGPALFEAVVEALRGSSFRATDLSCALARIRIDGHQALQLLSKACALDVKSDLVPGRAPRTLVAGLAVVVQCVETSTFECIVPLSYCDYLMAWMKDAAAEFAVTS
jgi:heterotetrameric sarcosine oxidase gamma subunit